MSSTTIVTIVGCRPQFVKANMVSRAIVALDCKRNTSHGTGEWLVHTGQHYSEGLSQTFFDQLGMPAPVVNLEVGSLGPVKQRVLIRRRVLKWLKSDRVRGMKFDCVLVYGDANSTLGGALAAHEMGIPVVHVEAGERCFHSGMVEEYNRVEVDKVTALHLCSSTAAALNLTKEFLDERVHVVGDVMYDAVLRYQPIADAESTILDELRVSPGGYYLATVHRAENTNSSSRLRAICHALHQLDKPVVLPLHPRTQKMVQRFKIELCKPVRVIPPVSYLDMLQLEGNAEVIITDSGGVQKEAYWMNVPCVVIRDWTEWRDLLALPSFRLVGAETDRIVEAVKALGVRSDAPRNLYGDGHAADRIAALLTAKGFAQ